VSERFSVFGTGAGAADTHISQTKVAEFALFTQDDKEWAALDMFYTYVLDYAAGRAS
tara:strand:- start:316 stop:486 length:171 start_codon:yes stop_codon:yes gene_type:complete